MPEYLLIDNSPRVVVVGPGLSRVIAVAQQGPAGPQGNPGVDGDTGPAGAGFPAGGTTGQSLIKLSSADYDTEWGNPPAAATWNSVTGKPAFATVATSGLYSDLTGTPDLTGYATTAFVGAGYQPLDATLTAFAALTIAANSLSVGTGADAFSQTAFAANTFPARASTGDLVAKTITDFGLSLVDDTTAGAARTTLGLVIGTNVQAWDADLDALAAWTTNGKTPFKNDLGQWRSVTPVTGVGVDNSGTFAGVSFGTTTDPTTGELTRTLSVDQTALSSYIVYGLIPGTPDLSAYAPLDSPALTGTPAAPTPAAHTSTTQVATTAFVVNEVALAVAGLLDFKGNLDCAADPNYPAASKGDTYYASVAGKVGGAGGKSVDVGDAIVAKADNAGGTEASVGTSWFVLEHNLQGALLAANNLSDLAAASSARSNLGLGSVENTALSTWTGTSSITTVGTLTGGATGAGFTVALTTSAVTGTLPAANLPALTGAVTSSAGSATTALVGDCSVHMTAAADGTYYLAQKISYACTINQIRGLQTTSGTCTVAVKINGTPVTGLSALAVTSTPQDVSATAANAVAAGDVVTLVVSASGSPADLRFSLKYTR